MLAPQIYLIVQSESDWDIQVYRDLGHLRETHKSLLSLSALLHVGFDRPTKRELAILGGNSLLGKGLLATAAARYARLPTAAFSAVRSAESDLGPLFWVTSLWDEQRGPPVESAADPNVSSDGSTADIQVEDEPDQGRRDGFGTLLAKLPPALLQRPLAQLDLSLRALNALRYKGIEKIADLKGWALADLLKIPNLGLKSAVEISKKLHQVAGLKENISLRLGTSYTKMPLKSVTGFVEEAKADEPAAAIENSVSGDRETLSFQEIVDRWLTNLPEAHASVMKRRMGMDGQPATLEVVGSEHKVTRERIRQIEVKALGRLNNMLRWHGKDLGDLIQDVLRERPYPLHAQALSAEVPFLRNCDYSPETWKYVLQKVDQSNIFALTLPTGATVVSRIHQEAWDKKVSDGIALLTEQVKKRASQSEVNQLLEALLGADAMELRQEFIAKVCEHAQFADVPGEAEAVLVGMGRSVETLIASVLEASDTPLHFSEIGEKVRLQRPETSDRFVHAAASNVGLLFGRGTFGLRKHLGLSPEEEKWLSDYASAVILEGAPDRQWHAHEICDVVAEDCPFADRLNHFVVNIALSSAPGVQYLGRFVWTTRGAIPQSTHDRIDFKNAVESVLVKAGRPLTTVEIFEELKAARGLSNVAQIHPSEAVIRLSPGVWGLRRRDVALSASAIRRLLDKLHARLKKQGDPISADEMPRVLDLVGNKKAQLAWTLLDAANADPRFVMKRDFVALANTSMEAGGPLTKKLKRILGSASGQTIDEIRRELGTSLSLSTEALRVALRGLGAVESRKSKKWTLGQDP